MSDWLIGAAQFVSDHGAEFVTAFALVSTTASALATVVRSDNGDPIFAKIVAVIDILAMNWGEARNADKMSDVWGRTKPAENDPS